MADISVTASRVSLLDPIKAEVASYRAGAVITKGQAVYIDTNGYVQPADANGVGTLQFRGIALNGGGIGDVVEVVHDGRVAGFDVASLNGDAKLYLSNTAGKIADAAGSTSVVVGRVVRKTDGPTNTKVIKFFTQWEADWS